MKLFHQTLVITSLLIGSTACSKANVTADYCPEFDASLYLEFDIAPLASVESGELFSSGGNPVSPNCMLKRMCDFNQWTHDIYNQGYVFQTDTYGHLLLQKTFPEEMATTVGKATGYFKAERFCKQFDLGASQNKELAKVQQ